MGTRATPPVPVSERALAYQLQALRLVEEACGIQPPSNDEPPDNLILFPNRYGHSVRVDIDPRYGWRIDGGES